MVGIKEQTNVIVNFINFHYLQTDPKEIQELKYSDCFSPTYKIFINWTDESNQIYSSRSSGK